MKNLWLRTNNDSKKITSEFIWIENIIITDMKKIFYLMIIMVIIGGFSSEKKNKSNEDVPRKLEVKNNDGI